MEIEQFYKIINIQNFTVNSDETQLVFSSNIGGKYDVWSIDLPNYFPTPLTYLGQNNYGLSFNHSNNHIYLSVDKEGNENIGIYRISKYGGTIEPILVNENNSYYLNSISSSNKLFFTTTLGNDSFLNICSLDLTNQEVKILFTGSDFPVYLACISPEEDKLIITKQKSNTYVSAYLFDLISSELRSIMPNENINHNVQCIEFLNENEILIITDYQSENYYLAIYHVKEDLFEKKLQIENADISSFNVFEGKKQMLLVIKYAIEEYLYIFNLQEEALTQLVTPINIFEHIEISKSDNIYILGRSSTTPSNIYVRKSVELEWLKITNNKVIGLDSADLSAPITFSYESFDGLIIEALLYKPQQHLNNNKTILWVHGGPQDSVMKEYNPLFQFLVANGFTIFAPNYRGSTGYGTKFSKLIEGNWGGDVRFDFITGVELLIKKDQIDKDNVIVVGASFGGYMALLLIGMHSEYFKGAVNLFGPTNLISLIEYSPNYWKNIYKELIGDPEIDRKKLLEQSPSFYTNDFDKPILIIQGERDQRVPINETKLFIERIQEQGGDIQYLFFDNEGHGFSQKSNQIKAHTTIFKFLSNL